MAPNSQALTELYSPIPKHPGQQSSRYSYSHALQLQTISILLSILASSPNQISHYLFGTLSELFYIRSNFKPSNYIPSNSCSSAAALGLFSYPTFSKTTLQNHSQLKWLQNFSVLPNSLQATPRWPVLWAEVPMFNLATYLVHTIRHPC